MTRRITVEEVLEAYRVTGLKPKQHIHFDGGSGCACAIGAIAVSSGCEPSYYEVVEWGNVHLACDYRAGFMQGFDGDRMGVIGSQLHDYCEGYADGTAVREAVFNQGAK